MTEYQEPKVRSIRLDGDVYEALQRLDISTNQFLRQLLSAEGVFETAVNVQPRPRKQTRKEKLLAELAALDPVGAERDDVELGNFELPRGGSVSQRGSLDAVGPSASGSRGKASVQTFHRTIRQKGDKGR